MSMRCSETTLIESVPNPFSHKELDMLITRKSMFTGVTRTLDIPCTTEQYNLWMSGCQCIQDVFPDLTPGQREFILTGVTDEEWDDAFPDEE
jgi:hypothetical protein